MAKSKYIHYKNVKEFAKHGLGQDDFTIFRISFKVELVKLIIDTRKKKNISQADLAKLLKTTQSVVSRFESGLAKNVTIDYLLKVVDVLGVTPAETIKAMKKAA